MAEDYREKIKKLLALAGSNNENEARAALLKAKELMAEHKLSEQDIAELKNKKIKTMRAASTYSKRRDAWANILGGIIAKNYCCVHYSEKEYDKQTRTICFNGFEEDVEIAMMVYDYAVDCIHSKIKQLNREYVGYSDEYRKSIREGYGTGFAYGVKSAFEKQKADKEEGWGLVMMVPEEVKESTSGMKHEQYQSAALQKQSRDARNIGFEDGLKFDPTRRMDSKSGQLMLA